MTKVWIYAFTIFFGFLSLAFSSELNSKANKIPLTEEQLEVYYSFIKTYDNGTKSDHLNIANQTSGWAHSDKSMLEKCLGGIELENFEQAQLVHVLSGNVKFPANVTLVDEKKQRGLIRNNDPHRTMRQGKSVEDAVALAFTSGLLTLSEVIFDKTHHFAVMRFTFVCGELCGHGEVLVFQKTSKGWVRTTRSCGGWVS
ncbi:MAG: hypothetical protein JST79_10345 [Acidobacteria bacterium]|nr:hypothetical protein [Acidobacteriota bacterium]